jgi:hypothetical protein
MVGGAASDEQEEIASASDKWVAALAPQHYSVPFFWSRKARLSAAQSRFFAVDTACPQQRITPFSCSKLAKTCAESDPRTSIVLWTSGAPSPLPAARCPLTTSHSDILTPAQTVPGHPPRPQDDCKVGFDILAVHPN